MHRGFTLQTLNALILTIIVIGIVSVILVKLSSPQPIKDLGNVYDQLMNPSGNTPPAGDFLTLENDRLVLHTERIPSQAVLTLTEETPGQKRALEYTHTRQFTILHPSDTLGAIHITLTQGRKKIQQAYAYTTGDLPTITLLALYDGLVLQQAQTEETISQLYHHCTIRDIPF